VSYLITENDAAAFFLVSRAQLCGFLCSDIERAGTIKLTYKCVHRDFYAWYGSPTNTRQLCTMTKPLWALKQAVK